MSETKAPNEEAKVPAGTMRVIKTELVWPGKYNDDGTRKDVPRVSLPFQVIETTEKIPISNLCCTGLYHFRTAGLYLEAYEKFKAGAAQEMGLSELYIAPLFNLLMHDGRDIRYHVIENKQVIFCGTPAEYNAYSGLDPR